MRLLYLAFALFMAALAGALVTYGLIALADRAAPQRPYTLTVAGGETAADRYVDAILAGYGDVPMGVG